MRYLHVSKPGGRPLNIGMNRAKRIARRADTREQATVVATLGGGLQRQHHNHQELVKNRHEYYGDRYEQLRSQTQEPAGKSADAADAGDAGGAVPESTAGTDH